MLGEIVRYAITAARQYTPYIPLVVGSYRIGYGNTEAYYFTRFAPADSLRKTKELAKDYFITMPDFLAVHGSLVSLSGICQLSYWCQETGIFHTILTSSELFTCANALFLTSHITSLLYFTNLYRVAHELKRRDPQLSEKVFVQAKWGVAYSFAAIAASISGLFNPYSLLTILLAGVASLTGCLKVLRDLQVN